MVHDTYPIYLIPEMLASTLKEARHLQQLNLKAQSQPEVAEIPTREHKSFSKKAILKCLKIFNCGYFGLLGLLTVLVAPNPILMSFMLVIGIALYLVLRPLLADELKAYFQQEQLRKRTLRAKNAAARDKFNANYHDNWLQQVAQQQFSPQDYSLYVYRKICSSDFTVEYGEPDSAAQAGVSEAFFLNYLNHYFGQDFKIETRVLDIPGFAYGYSTDFALIHPQSGLALDIEIDEPYEGRSKQPHHCQDDPKDARRNKFFIERNWLVIRFSEYQIASQPDACCRAIAVFLALFLDETLFEDLNLVKPLRLDSCWNKVKARRLAKQGYRETYLADYKIYQPRSRRVN